MKKAFLGWVACVLVCTQVSCTSHNVTGTDSLTPLFLLAYSAMSILIYHILINKVLRELLKKVEPPKTEKPDLKSLKLNIEHKKNELSLVEKILRGKKKILIQHLKREKVEYEDLLNEARKYARIKKLPEKDKISTEAFIEEMQGLIPRLDQTTEMARKKS